VLSTDEDEGIVLRRRANIRSRGGRSVGILYVTTRRLSFCPMRGGRQVDVRLDDIQSVDTTGLIFKKLRVCTADAAYTMFMKGATNVVSLIRALMDVPATGEQPPTLEGD